MEKVIEYIHKELKTLHPRVFMESPPTGTAFPYVTYHFPSSSEQNYREDITFVVDVWDENTDPQVVEQLTSKVNKHFHRLRHLDVEAGMQVSFFRISRLQVPDPDVKIRHRQLRFNMKTYLI